MKALETIRLRHILGIALLLRLLAAVFTPGYAFHDDHFGIVELAWLWGEGRPPWGEGEVYLFSLLYPAVHAGVFWLCDAVGLSSPEGQMLLVRILHALYSVVGVYYGYRLANRLGGREVATFSGLALALFYFFPYLSVRSLREVVCIPPLLAGFYYLQERHARGAAVAGVCFGLAFVLRLQAILLPLGAGAAILIQGLWRRDAAQWKAGLWLAFSFILTVSLTQFLFDWLFWGHPLASLQAYSAYNATHSHEYPNGPPHQYLLMLMGVLLPPLSLLLLLGWVRSWKPLPMLAAGTVLFLLFHSFYPGKQERFILPLVPFIIILGFCGLVDWHRRTGVFSRRRTLWKGIAIFVLLLNTLGLGILTFTYTKRPRVETLNWLRNQGDANQVLFESEEDLPALPLYYLRGGDEPVLLEHTSSAHDSVYNRLRLDSAYRPDYVVFVGPANLAQRTARLQTIYPTMQPAATVHPGIADRIAFWLNPKYNRMETWHVFKVK